MKKKAIVLLAITVILILTACPNPSSPDSTPSTPTVPQDDNSVDKPIFFSSSSENGLSRMSTDGSSVERIIPWGYHPDVSPDESKIVYHTNDGYWDDSAQQWVSTDNEIWLANIDGSNIINLTNNDANDYNPCFSPDGSKILFTTDRNGNLDLYTIDLDGKNPNQITSSVHDESDAEYSPDGSQIAYSHQQDDYNTIMIADSDGQNAVDIIQDSSLWAWGPHWHPDGSEILFSTLSALYLINTDGTEMQRVYKHDNYECRDGSYSPDGSEIVFEAKIGNYYQICSIDSDGTNFTQLTDESNNCFHANWIRKAIPAELRGNWYGLEGSFSITSDSITYTKKEDGSITSINIIDIDLDNKSVIAQMVLYDTVYYAKMNWKFRNNDIIMETFHVSTSLTEAQNYTIPIDIYVIHKDPITNIEDIYSSYFGGDSYFPIILGKSWINNDGNEYTITNIDYLKNIITISNSDGTGYVTLTVSEDDQGYCIKILDTEKDDDSDIYFLPLQNHKRYEPLCYENDVITEGFTWKNFEISNDYNIEQTMEVTSISKDITPPSGDVFNNCMEVSIELNYPDGYNQSSYITSLKYYLKKGIGFVQVIYDYSDGNEEIVYIENDTPPPPEVPFLAPMRGDRQVTLYWQIPDDADFDHVEISYGVGNTNTIFTGTISESSKKHVSHEATLTGLTNGTGYTFRIRTVDTAGKTSVGKTITSTPLLDNTVPYVESISPANNSTGVSTDITDITITFSEPMINLMYSYSSELVPISDPEWVDNQTFVLHINEDLEKGEEYHIVLNPSNNDPAFMDLSGNPVSIGTEFSFTTEMASSIFPSEIQGTWVAAGLYVYVTSDTFEFRFFSDNESGELVEINYDNTFFIIQLPETYEEEDKRGKYMKIDWELYDDFLEVSIFPAGYDTVEEAILDTGKTVTMSFMKEGFDCSSIVTTLFGEDSYFPIIMNTTWEYQSGKSVILDEINYAENKFVLSNPTDEGDYWVSLGKNADGYYLSSMRAKNSDFLPAAIGEHYNPICFENSIMMIGYNWTFDEYNEGYVRNIEYEITGVDTDITVYGGTESFHDCIEITETFSYPSGWDATVYPIDVKYYLKKGVGYVYAFSANNDGTIEYDCLGSPATVPEIPHKP